MGLAVIRREHMRQFLRPGDCGAVGDGCFYLDEITLLNDGNISLGVSVVFGVGCWLNGFGGIEIDDGTMIGPYTFIHSANHQSNENIYERDQWEAKPVSIGHHVWIGAHSVILPGTTIGEFCVVGAGSVLSGSYPPKRVIYGNKARAH